MDIAVVGMAIKIPQSRQFGRVLECYSNQRDTVNILSDKRKRWLEKYLKGMLPNGRKTDIYPEGAYIENIEEFDNELFGITPKESELIDPNQRIFLQVAFKALEDAGYPINFIKNSNTGCICWIWR